MNMATSGSNNSTVAVNPQHLNGDDIGVGMTLEEAIAAHDKDSHTTARILFAILALVCSSSVLLALIDPSINKQQRIGRVASWSIGLLIVAAAGLAYRRWGLSTAARWSCVSFFAMIIGTSLLTGVGYATSGFFALSAVVVISGTLVSGRMALGAGIFVAVSLAVVYYCQSRGIISGPTSATTPPLITYFVTASLSAIGVGWLMWRHGKLFWTVLRGLGEARKSLDALVAKRTADLAQALSRTARDDEEKRLLLQRLHSQIEDERHRIMRDMHDQMGSSLAAIRRMATVLVDSAKTLECDDRKRDNIITTADAMLTSADTMYVEVRRIINELGPELLEVTGLGDALSDLLNQFRLANPACKVLSHGLDSSEDYFDLIPRARALAMYRLVQEALTNVSKHAKATHVSLDVWREDDHLCLRIADNGVGFDASHEIVGNRLGLASIRERTAALHGELSVKSSPGRGTELTVDVPLNLIPSNPTLTGK